MELEKRSWNQHPKEIRMEETTSSLLSFSSFFLFFFFLFLFLSREEGRRRARRRKRRNVERWKKMVMMMEGKKEKMKEEFVSEISKMNERERGRREESLTNNLLDFLLTSSIFDSFESCFPLSCIFVPNLQNPYNHNQEKSQ